MKDCKVYVNGKSKEIQSHLFKLGAKWSISRKSETEFANLDQPFLYIRDGKIMSGNNMTFYVVNELPEVTLEEILAMSFEYEFKPFDKVLVRDYDDMNWFPAFFCHTERTGDGRCMYYTIFRVWFRQCIPYEGNEHLAHTTDKPQ